MVEKPILFSAPMVRAILDGRKTMTRRVLKPQPTIPFDAIFYRSCEWSTGDALTGESFEKLKVRFSPGDMLWVRENITRFDKGSCDQWVWYHAGRNFEEPATANSKWIMANFPHQGGDERWMSSEGPAGGKPYSVPAIHMPRWASRITLRVSAVKVERLHDISEEDAQAEGVCSFAEGFDSSKWPSDRETRAALVRGFYGDARKAFWHLFETINGPGSSEANPWVAAYSFERVKP